MPMFKITTLGVEGEEDVQEIDSDSKEFKDLFFGNREPTKEDVDELDGWTNGWISVEKS